MYYYISGKLVHKTEKFVVVDAGGVGYKIYTSISNIGKLGEIGKSVTVYTYTNIKEDAMDLYGFLFQEELSMFEILIGVSGVGPRVGLAILDTLTPASFALAVVTNDAKSITRAPGVGPKLAQRIILELKDKMKNDDIAEVINSNDDTSFGDFQNVNDPSSEASSALIVLGYQGFDAKRAVSAVALEGMSTEDIIKKALLRLSRN